MQVVLALDAGTTSVRALAVDPSGAILAVSQQEFTQFYPEPGLIEHDPEEIWLAAANTLKDVSQQVEEMGHDIVCIGITNQRETSIIWDQDSGKPLHKLLDILKDKKYRNKSYTTQKGRKIVGKEFNINQIYKILNNQLYLGKINHKGEVYDGEHDSIIGQDLWDSVHAKMDKKQFTYSPKKTSEQPKLVGKLYDYLGHKLSPTYSYKYSSNGRYKMRYYINREISTQGKTASEFKRIRAELIDDVVLLTETQTKKAMLSYIKQERQLLEGAAGVAVAALIKQQKNLRGQKVGVVVCGGNISINTLQKIIK